MPFYEIRFQDIIDILIVAYIIYKILLLFRGTRAMQLVKGLLIVAGIGILANVYNLRSLVWLIRRFFGAIIIAIPVLFQPELRRALEELGKGGNWRSKGEAELQEQKANEVARALSYCAEHRIGAIFVLERNTSLKEYWQEAQILNSAITYELIVSIFWEGTPLHDGALICNKQNLIAGACYLPLTRRQDLSSWYGTRHRAALGLTELTDAIALVVSEERGEIRAAVAGNFSRPLTQERLANILKNYFFKSETDSGFFEVFAEELRENLGGNN